MRIPRYWAEGRAHFRSRDKQRTVRRFGWSDDSEADAQSMADARAKAALAKALGGATEAPNEPKRAYDGADGVPIREEILETHGSMVVTRNAYGARCLNVPDVAFVDVDFETPPGCAGSSSSVLGGIGAGLALAWWLQSGWVALGAVVLGGPVGVYVAYLLKAFWTGLRGGDARVAQRRIQAYADAHPDRHLRVYRTPAGFRVLVMDRTLDPTGPETASLFDALGADPLYRRMCVRQQCFRARLTAKPWRLDLADPRPSWGVWPLSPDRRAVRDAWLEKYEAKAREASACRFVMKLGPDVTVHATREVMELHDRESGATSERPLA